MKKIISVIGSNTCSPQVYNFAKKLGEKLSDMGFIVVSGGCGGVMKAVFEGVHVSKNYKNGSTIGIIKGYKKTEANEYTDITIPTGMGYARNIIVVSMADIVIAIAGGAGTLSEIALASQLKKTIILVYKFNGWSKYILRFGNTIDHRGVRLHKAKYIDEILGIIKMSK